jgi:predicted regulator of Ras-like GTPase activity (Roadblock/LC7/MglB family)
MISQDSKISQDPQVGNINSFSQLSAVVTSIGEEIEHLAKFDDVKAVLLFRVDGRVLESQYKEEISETVLIVVSWVRNIISKTTEELQRGSRSVKYDKEINPKVTIPVYFYLAGRSSILVTLLNSKANSGLMEIEMSRTAKRLGWIIDQKRLLS